jgi:lipopolysaccharide/colanic/teichoic acid biosynthesis glycosyltransferase
MAKEQQLRTIRVVAVRLRGLMETIRWPARHTRPGIYSVEQFRAALERERARVDRNGHHMALALIQVGRSRTSKAPRVIDVLKDRLRLTDEAGWFDQSRIGVLMPYTSCEGAWHMVADLCRIMNGDLSLSACSVYTYPHDRAVGAGGACRAKCDELLAESFLASSSQTDGPDESVVSTSSVSVRSAGEPGHVNPIETTVWAGPSAWQRGLDIICALLGLAALAPVFILAALFIKLVSPGPAFFKQVRIGRGGRPFVLWKFRTMKADADSSLHRNHMAALIRSGPGHGGAGAKPMTKLDNDPRVIPLGGMLRRTCIDELPQLINVLRGEMSLVGPRPPIPYEVREYLPWQTRRLDAVPGLTGLWQVSGKNKLTFEEMVRLDIQYNRKNSFWMNVKILLRTPRAILLEIADA